MTEENNLLETVTPTGEEQAQSSELDSTASDTEQTAESTETQPEPKPKTDWAQKRIDRLTAEKYEAKRQAAELAQELAQYRQPADNTATQDIPRLVQEQARQLVAEEKFNDACNRVFKAGVKESPEFEANLKTLQSVGEINREFLETVTDMDAGHRVLNYLGAHPEEAEEILSLPPRKQVMALAKIEASIGKPSPAPVSNVPAPIRPVGSKAAPVEPEHFATTAEYIAWRNKSRK